MNLSTTVPVISSSVFSNHLRLAMGLQYLFVHWSWQVYVSLQACLVESMCPYQPIRACSPIVQGCGTVHRGTCCDKHMSVSPSRLALAVCCWGTGRWPRRWWYATVYSSGNPCTVHSSAAWRHECCSSPGEQGEWGQRTCSWSDTDPAAPTGKTK